MDPIQAILKFVQKELPFVPVPSEDQVLALASAEGHKALLDRFKAQAGAVKAKLVREEWYPLPSARPAQGRWHTLVASVLYYVAEVAISEHGLDNLVAGALQGFFLQPVLNKVDPVAYNAAGKEDQLIADVGAALADLICPAPAAPTDSSAPAPPAGPATP